MTSEDAGHDVTRGERASPIAKALMLGLVQVLDPQEYAILKARTGLGTGRPRSLRGTGRIVGLSYVTVWRWEPEIARKIERVFAGLPAQESAWEELRRRAVSLEDLVRGSG